MLKKTDRFLPVIFFILLSQCMQAQLYFNMGNYRNTAYATTGYNGAFGNVTIGAARRDHVRLLNREVIGILDIALPVSGRFFTRHIIKKGFQTDIYKNNNFRVPFTFASSSIIRHNSLVKYHDVTAEFSFNPGIYTPLYTLALDVRYELIAFRHSKYSAQYRHSIDHAAKNHWEEPLFNIFKCGFVAGLNLNRITMYIKTGYERKPVVAKNYLPGYAVIGCGFKFGNKPTKNAAVK